MPDRNVASTYLERLPRSRRRVFVALCLGGLLAVGAWALSGSAPDWVGLPAMAVVLVAFFSIGSMAGDPWMDEKHLDERQRLRLASAYRHGYRLLPPVLFLAVWLWVNDLLPGITPVSGTNAITWAFPLYAFLFSLPFGIVAWCEPDATRD